MAAPTPPNFNDELLGFLKTNSIAGGLFLLLWKGISTIGAHFSEKRRTELKELVDKAIEKYCDDEIAPEIKRLEIILVEQEKEIKNLRELLYNRK